MNRIYQGRVARAEIIDERGDAVSAPEWNWKNALWDHHVLFQDAVNYWAFGLAEMARGMTQKNDKGEDKPTWMAEFAEQVRGRWEDFTHKGTKREGLKHSLSRTLKISLSEITWEQCAEKIFVAVLAKYPGRKDPDGNDVLHRVIGELFPDKSRGKPQALANEDPRWLCWKDKKGEFPADKTYRTQQGINDFMADLFLTNEAGLREVAKKTVSETFLSGVTKTNAEEPDDDTGEDTETPNNDDNEPGDDAAEVAKLFSGLEAINQLVRCVKTAKALLKEPGFARDFALLGGSRYNARGELAWLLKSVRREKTNVLKSPESLAFQEWKRNGKGKDNERVELYVLLWFAAQHHPQGVEFAATLLRARLKNRLIGTFRKNSPGRYLAFVKEFDLAGLESEGKETSKQIETAKKAAERIARGEAKPRPAITDFIPRVRKAIGYVFPSFTAIRGFAMENGMGTCPHGEMAWKSFDGAAYEEAIKAPHQIRQKQKERDKERKDFEALEKLYTSKGRLTGKGDDGEDEDRIPGGFKKDGDPRFSVMEKIRDALRVEDGIEEGEFYEYTISEAALRGYDELRVVWNKEVEAGETFSDAKAEKLKQRLKEHQAEHRDDMGAARLFEELLKEGNWCVWQNEKEEIEKERAVENWSDDFVRDYQQYVEVVAKRKKKEKPIQYTPADATESRRLFDFKGGAGLEHTEKEETLSFTTQISVKQPDGFDRVQDIRIFYTAPRLLRDEARVLSASENLKSANWMQPMMRTLGVPEDSRHDFSAHAVLLMPHWHPGSRSSAPDRLLLNFVLTPKEDKFIASLRKSMKREKWPWAMQFNWNGDKNESTLRWPHEDWSKVANKAGFTGRWFERAELTKFRLLAVDLGQKQASAYALIEVNCRYSDKEKRQARFIGRTEAHGESRDWYAHVVLTGLHKLPGEDAEVLRPEFANGKPVPGTIDFREELSGSAGRKATVRESDIAFKYLVDLEQVDLLDDGSRMTKNERAAMTEDERSRELVEWRKNARRLMSAFTVPEQNAKMLIALRRARTFANRLHRWNWFLTPVGEERKDADGRRRTAIKEIAEAEEHPWLDKNAHAVAKELHKQVLEAQKAGVKISVSSDARITVPIKTQLESLTKQLPGFLEIVANRIYASRKGRFVWVKNPDKNDCHLLDFAEFTEKELETRKPVSKDEKRLAGQRGLSMERIEQLEELRKICQSLNQTLRRPIGEKPPISRDDSVPDPCPKILAKLDEIKEQRRNQTAHMILAEALGLKLAGPSERPKVTDDATRKAREMRDAHGEYMKVDDKGRSASKNPEAWRGIVDFIVIEDLSRYRTSQSRSPRENSRLMKWCHREIRDKLKEMCEQFGLPLLETPAAYSSRFCSRTGVAGFRATEISVTSLAESKWKWKMRKPEDETKEKDAAKKRRAQWENIFEAVRQANEGRDGRSKGQTYRTLLVPETGGSIFVPIADLDKRYERPAKDASNPKKPIPIIQYLPVQLDDGQEKEPRLIHSDVNAAVTVGLRAVANPRTWSIHSRLRSERESDVPPRPKNKKPKKQKGAPPQADALSEVKPDRFFVAESEKRKFRPRPKPKQKAADEGTGETPPQADTRIRIELIDLAKADLKSSESHHPNFFADVAKLQGTYWGAAELKGLDDGETAPPHLVSSKALWRFVNQQAWKRCMTINVARLRAWGIASPENLLD